MSERCRPELPLLSVVRERGVIVRDISNKDENRNVIPDDLTNYKVVEQFQFAMNKMKAWQGSYGVSDHLGIVSPAYFVFDVQGVDNSYFHRAIRSKAYVSHFARASDGVRIGQWDLSTSAMRDISFLIPPPSEQDAIVRFLDHADRRIRRYIRAKEKLIALLEEQKQAIIHQAVTGRIDVRTGQPYPTYKPSHVEWWGRVPAHWEQKRLKQCTRTISKGTTPSTEGRDISENGPVRFIKAENVTSSGIVNHPSNFIDKDTNNILKRSQLNESDILFVIAGATLGKTSIVAQDLLPANINQAIAFIRPDKYAAPNYLALFLSSPRIQELTWLHAVQAAQPNLSMTNLGNFFVPLPTIPEQLAITEYATSLMTECSKARDQARREMALLREYRARLIADVVTGKLDVREAAAALPEVDPLAADDEADDPFDAGDAPAFDEDQRVAEVVG